MQPEHGSVTVGPISSDMARRRFATDGTGTAFLGAFAVRVAFAFFVLATINSCDAPARPDGEVRPVTAWVLVRHYRDDHDSARITFTGQLVRVLVVTSLTVGNEIHWCFSYGGKPASEPAIVFRFPGRPAFKAPGWIEGDCRGRVDDDHDRGGVGYRFSVTVTDCRVVPAPRQSGP